MEAAVADGSGIIYIPGYRVEEKPVLLRRLSGGVAHGLYVSSISV